jgi:C-terminal processing protease CtpA/Prc
VAKYRLAPHFGHDHLSAARFVYREGSNRFDQREREAVLRLKSDFVPEWEPPVDEFSEWHYLVLSKRPNDDRFDYRKPVAILMDERCFSATDIFLGAFKGWPNVTLIGQPSRGGSARSQVFRLPQSGITVRCASMASFQPNGKLYDTNGITPDITVVRPPEYYLARGEDVILRRALEFLKEQAVETE